MLGNTVRAHRRRLGLSQEELATRARISARALRKIESYETDRPRPATVRLLADAFELQDAEREAFYQLALGTPIGIPPVPHPAPSGAPGPRLLGREQEMALLRRHATTVTGGALHLVWVTGETGLGKTALLTEVSTVLNRDGWTTATSANPPFQTPPGWAWIGVLRQLVDLLVPAGVADELADRCRALLRESDSDGAAGATPFHLARLVVEVLRRCSDVRPVLIGLEDAQLADRDTLQILRYLFSELSQQRLLVVVTVDPTVLSPALDAVRATLTGARVGRVALGGLGEPDVARLLAARCPVEVPPAMISLVSGRTAGNPLFVKEIAELIAAEGLTAATAQVPECVRLMLTRRLALLPAHTQEMLRTIAGLGTEVGLDVLLSLEPTEAEALLMGLEAAIRVGLLVETGGGSVRFPTALIRDAVQQTTSTTQRFRLHARVRAALERARSSAATLTRQAIGAAGHRQTVGSADALHEHLRALESVILAAVGDQPVDGSVALPATVPARPARHPERCGAASGPDDQPWTAAAWERAVARIAENVGRPRVDCVFTRPPEQMTPVGRGRETFAPATDPAFGVS